MTGYTIGFERYGLERDAFKIGDDFYDVAYMALRLDDTGLETDDA